MLCKHGHVLISAVCRLPQTRCLISLLSTIPQKYRSTVTSVNDIPLIGTSENTFFIFINNRNGYSLPLKRQTENSLKIFIELSEIQATSSSTSNLIERQNSSNTTVD